MSIISLKSQSPQAFNYQSIVRGPNGNPMPNTSVTMRFTILQGNNPGTPIYIETQAGTTNPFGLYMAQIGNGNPVQGVFASINWATGSKYLEVELDVNNTGTFVNMGITQFISVPYALHATKSDTAAYVLNNAGPPAVITDTVFASLNLSAVTVSSMASQLGTGNLTFTKTYPNSNVELFLNSNIYSGSFTGASYIGFWLQVDGNQARYTTQYYIQQSNATQFVNLDAIFPGLSAGAHTVSIWGLTDAGTSTNVTVDNGGFGGSIVVKETN